MDFAITYNSLVCWSLTSLCHSNGHIKTMPAREKLIPLLPGPGFDPSFSGHNDRRAIISKWTRLLLRPLSHRGWLLLHTTDYHRQSLEFVQHSETVLPAEQYPWHDALSWILMLPSHRKVAEVV